MCAYDPVSYHNGSVWPHDNALLIAGLMRYGFVAEAQRIAEGLLDAAQAFGGRLPELFCGFDRSEFTEPVPYPTSCSPQAWAAASPVQIMRTLLRFDPVMPRDRLWIAPVLPEGSTPLRIDGIALGTGRTSLQVSEQGTVLEGLPAHVEVLTEPYVPEEVVREEVVREEVVREEVVRGEA
jgi:glycogen debranching enzyme